VNPDKLFDYLDGKLPEHERHRLEEQLMNDAEARREFDVARRIHAATGGGREHLEVVDEVVGDRSQGKRAVRQILLATLVLVAVNVFLGLLYIAHHESTNPNRALLDQQNREELRQALDRAAADALTPPPLGVTELNLTVEKGREQAVADEIVQLTKRLKGTATAGIPDDARMKMLVELGGERSQEFRDALQNLDGVKEISGNMHGPSGANRPGNISVVVQLTETK
jgi:Tfp pilus assembly protein PilN